MFFEPRTQLTGDKITLIKPRALFSEIATLFQLIDNNRKNLLPWLTLIQTPTLKNQEDIFKLLLEIESKWKQQEIFTYLVYHNETLIGIISALISVPANNGTEIYFWQSKEFTKKGFIQQALSLIEKEFFFLGVERLSIKCDVENYTARGIAIKAGYRLEGIMRHAYWNAPLKSYRDLYVFSKIKNE
ncbi:MAG: GNAT family N-acetyltransferase [Alphaproteobacteria bacterium]|nr:GNAT family N-acetyltransferase [Alphaproteobacteria bacterium]